jgi:hypothetical protein
LGPQNVGFEPRADPEAGLKLLVVTHTPLRLTISLTRRGLHNIRRPNVSWMPAVARVALTSPCSGKSVD